MKKLILMLTIFALHITLVAQLSAPNVEAVYGGRINAITGYAKGVNTTRIFISTESANSIFYADINSTATPPTFGSFTVMPGVDANANYGSGITKIQAHANSGKVFFIYNEKILSSSPTSTTVQTTFTGNGMIDAFLIEDNYLFILDGGSFHFGKLDATGNFTEDTNSPLTVTNYMGQKTIFVHPMNNRLYVFTGGSTPHIYKFADAFYSLSSSTTITDISPSTLSAYNWKAFGIGPDGRLFIFGDNGGDKYEAYSDNEINWTEFSLGISGTNGPNVDFSGNSSNYFVYFANCYSDSKGIDGSWKIFGNAGYETHPNDGSVFVDPINNEIVYMTTDQGIGASTDNGATIFEIDDGVEAVQVNDFSMSTNKESAWLASKSGIRKVICYLTNPTWTNAMFPQDDGSPYFSAEMSKSDTNRVFVGNVRIYKTTDNGNTWDRVFTPEVAPYNFPSTGTNANAIEECSFSPNIVMAGFEVINTDKGGLFVSEDYGATWSQIHLETTTDGQDVDVADIVFVQENSNIVAYVGVIYDGNAPQGRSIYRVVKNGTNWVASQDMDASGTSVGYPITATIQDLEVSVTQDTIYATGTDAGINHPITYYKILSGSNLWTTLTTDGYPFATGKQSTAVTIGRDTVYVAVDNEIYYYPPGATQWYLGYSYPVGTRINFLYYDDLLAGTSLGLYGHHMEGTNAVRGESNNVPKGFVLYQNFPNPFSKSSGKSSSTTIRFSIPSSNFNSGKSGNGSSSLKESNVRLTVYNLIGQQIAEIVNQPLKAGVYNVKFDASNLASGIYYYKLESGNFALTKKMVILK